MDADVLATVFAEKARPSKLQVIFRWTNEQGYYHRLDTEIPAEGTPEQIEAAICAAALVTCGAFAKTVEIEYEGEDEDGAEA